MSVQATKKLRKLVYDKLIGDAPLVALVGGLSKIKHGQPLNFSDYPCLVYRVESMIPDTYEPDIPFGQQAAMIEIESFDSSENITLVEQIDDAVYGLLHGQNLTNSEVRVYTCLKRSTRSLFEEDIRIQRILSIYELTYVIK